MCPSLTESGMIDSLSTVDDDLPFNPLDLVEELVVANDWSYHRMDEDEIVVEIAGHWCHYRLYFMWQPDFGALQFCCRLDVKIQDSNKRKHMNELLALVNERMWLGHFDISTDEPVPVFRHAVLLRGMPGASPEQIEDLIEISLSECERFYPAFQTLIWGGKTAEEAIASAIIEPIGEA